jgi:hypothetical protein
MAAAVKAPIVPTSLPTLHIYRQLLREAGYLPPALSQHISAQIRRRFHQHIDTEPNIRKRLSHARNALRRIRAANYGDKSAMTNLMLRAFGRQSVRRKVLLSEFVQPQDRALDSKSLEALLDDATSKMATLTTDDGNESSVPGKTPRHAFLDKWDKPKLLRFIKSQQTQQGTSRGVRWTEKPVTSLNENVQVPAKDTWGRAPTPTLIRAKQAAWWKRNAVKIMPPLGKGEWDLLQRLSNGAQTEDDWKIPQRRTQGKQMTADINLGEDMDLERYAEEPTAQIENRRTSRWRRFYGSEDLNPFGGQPKGRQTGSDRWYRRRYAQVWQMTPHMERDPTTLASRFIWGKPKAPDTAPTHQQMQIFEGVDAKGKKQALTGKP